MKIPRTIYAIQHNKTKRVYVGSSANVEKRYWQHIHSLRRNEHKVEDMQDDFNEYGEDFSLFLLEEIVSYSERSKEYEWMTKLKSHIRGKGYNYKDGAMVTKRNKLPLKSGIPSV